MRKCNWPSLMNLRLSTKKNKLDDNFILDNKKLVELRMPVIGQLFIEWSSAKYQEYDFSWVLKLEAK